MDHENMRHRSSQSRGDERSRRPAPRRRPAGLRLNGLAHLCLVQAMLQAGQTPVLEFPEAGLDDPAAYDGYATRFFRDARGNAFQIYLDARSGRVVHVWADATNASAAFTARDTLGRPAALVWGDPGAAASAAADRRAMRHRLASPLDALDVGWFVLGTMRQERDFQYGNWHRRPYGDSTFVLPELADLVTTLERLPAEERERHLALLGAREVHELRARLTPRVTLSQDGAEWAVLIEQPSLDGRNRLTLELRGDPGVTTARAANGVISLRARAGGGVGFDVTAATDAPALTPLDRDRIFNDAFDAFYARQRGLADSLRRALAPADYAADPGVLAFRRLDRAVRGLELLSYEEKLLASLPNYATYFGRDMMMAALMLEPIVSVDVQEHVIASVLRKVAPSGDVSHEEALGGQAIRENAAEYAALARAWADAHRADSAAAAEHLARARELLEDLQAVRENYRMIDDDFQLPVLVSRYLARSDVPAERKRRFLSEAGAGGRSRMDALVRNLALVARLAHPYAEQPAATNLVEFRHRDADGWLPGSWRDSRVGYGNGRFAMDVNVAWVPKALEAVQEILLRFEALGLSVEGASSRAPGDGSTLDEYHRNPAALRAAIATWRASRRHFEVRLEPEEIRARVEASLESWPGSERDYWRRRLAVDTSGTRPLWFLALALDSLGRPIPAANTDPATDLFLEAYTEQVVRGSSDPAAVLRMLDVFVRPYPVGLLVEGLGPVVVNDAFASPAVQQRFRHDLYHSPQVVWGREVNLLLLGLAKRIAAAYDPSGRMRGESEALRSYVDALRRILHLTREAVDASGLRHNELWSYRVEGATLRPIRYGTSSDIQLWNLTDLAVQFLADRLPPP